MEILDILKSSIEKPLRTYTTSTMQFPLSGADSISASEIQNCKCDEVANTHQSPGAGSGVYNLICRCGFNQVGTQSGSEASSMVYLGLPELFFAQMKAAFIKGTIASLPYLLIEIWGLLGSTLLKGKKMLFWLFSFGTYMLFVGGALFGYLVVFPLGFDFFLSLTQFVRSCLHYPLVTISVLPLRCCWHLVSYLSCR